MCFTFACVYGCVCVRTCARVCMRWCHLAVVGAECMFSVQCGTDLRPKRSLLACNRQAWHTRLSHSFPLFPSFSLSLSLSLPLSLSLSLSLSLPLLLLLSRSLSLSISLALSLTLCVCSGCNSRLTTAACGVADVHQRTTGTSVASVLAS